MTTYTYTGISVQYNASDVAIGLGTSTFSIVTSDADTSFSYTSFGIAPGDDFPTVDLNQNNTYNEILDGVALSNSFESIIGQFGWGAGNLSYILDFYDPGTNTDHIFQLGGTVIPDFATPAEFNAFGAGFTSAGTATGAFAPSSAIDYASLPGVVITQNDVIEGFGGRDIFHGGIGRDRIFGHGGNDKLFGDAGNDRLFGDAKNDNLFGGGGNDKLVGGSGADKLVGGGGRDQLVGGAGNDSLNGGDGSDILSGGAGRDNMAGGKGLDVLNGGKGADILMGGKGNDDMRGNGGSDVFLYGGGNNEGSDVIFDFNLGVDLIRIGGAVVNAVSDVSFADAGGGDTLLSWRGTEVTLFGVDIVDSGLVDFDFI